MILEGLGDFLDRFEAAAARPAVPAIEEDLGVGRALGGAEDLAQAFLDAKSAMGFEVEGSQIDELDELLAAPVVRVFQPNVAAALEFGDGLDLLAADLVDGFVDQLDDMELVEGDRGPWNMLAEPGTVAGGHVDADIANLLGAGAVGLEIVGELRHDLGFSPFAGKQQTRRVEVVKQADVVVSAPCGGFVDTDRDGAGEVLLRACLIDVVIQGSPDTHIADAEQLSDLTHRHRLAHRHEQRLHQQCEPAVGTCPRYLDLGGFGASIAAYAGNRSMNIGLILEEIEMAPGTLPGIVDRLLFGTAMRAGEPRSRIKANVKVDPSLNRIEGNVYDLPGRRQAKRGGEQHLLIQTVTSQRKTSSDGMRAATPSERTPCGQSVTVASDRVDKSGTTRGKLCVETAAPRKRVAPNLPTLIHPLPTLRRTGPVANRERLRRNNNIIFESKGAEAYHPYPHET